VQYLSGEGNEALLKFWIAIVQNADSSSLFDDLDAALRSGSSEKRVAMLRQVTDLFLNEADRLNEKQIEVFDSVLVQLIERIETRTLMEISERLALVANAPIDLTLKLARHSEIGVARPILTSSSRLTTAELVEIAKTKSQDHLLAISERAEIETVTDVLVNRGNQAVVHSIAGNSGAQFSENGFAALLKAAETDDKLAEKKRKYEETVVALSLLSSASLEIIKPLMKSPRDDGLLIPCKVADCKWETVSAILATKLPPGSAPRRNTKAQD
jgi:uncharacterized protein (DUF2336 family)